MELRAMMVWEKGDADVTKDDGFRLLFQKWPGQVTAGHFGFFGCAIQAFRAVRHNPADARFVYFLTVLRSPELLIL